MAKQTAKKTIQEVLPVTGGKERRRVQIESVQPKINGGRFPVKRIVEDYHSGKIFVKQSEIDVGTTFRIQLHKLNDINVM